MGLSEKYSMTTQVLALSHVAGISPRLLESLIHRFQNLEGIFGADAETLSGVEGLTKEAVDKITHPQETLEKAREFESLLANRDIGVVTRFDDSYPQLLFELNDPPAALYVRGKMLDNAKKTVTIVGAENATNEGIELTVKAAGTFGNAGVQVISSLSKGIDAATHVGAAKTGGSFCVLDSGFDHVHPSEHMPLAIDIAQSGGVITEYPPATEYSEKNFPAANRLLVGMAHAVVVTELYNDSQRTLDILTFCKQIGKLAFFLVDPEHGTLAEEHSLEEAISCGAIPMVGLEKVDEIINALV